MKNGTQLSKITKMNPKVARAKLRRVKVPSGMTVGKGWKFTAKGVSWVKKVLAA